MRTFTIQLTAEQLDIIGKLLGEAPYRIAAPVVGAINQQISAQEQSPDGTQNGQSTAVAE